MTNKTIWKCDSCGIETETSGVRPCQFWTVFISASSEGYTTSYNEVGRIDVCRPCLEKIGIHIQKKPDVQEEKRPPTIEEMIIDIVNRYSGQQ